MGFCLFKHAFAPGLFFAVNAGSVLSITPVAMEKKMLGPAVLLDLGIAAPGFRPLAVGRPEEAEATLRQAAKIGVHKLSLETVGGQGAFKAAPMIINNPDRVVLAREFLPEEFSDQAQNILTASEVFFADGTRRVIRQRPGLFAFRANAGGKVPVMGA